MFVNNYFHLVHSLYKHNVYFKENCNSRAAQIIDELKELITPLVLGIDKPRYGVLDKTFPDNLKQIHSVITKTFTNIETQQSVIILFTELINLVDQYKIYNLDLKQDDFNYFCDIGPKTVKAIETTLVNNDGDFSDTTNKNIIPSLTTTVNSHSDINKSLNSDEIDTTTDNYYCDNPKNTSNDYDVQNHQYFNEDGEAVDKDGYIIIKNTDSYLVNLVPLGLLVPM